VTILLLSSLTSFLLNRILLTPAVILCNIPQHSTAPKALDKGVKKEVK
jgi:hypothetical protein